MIALGLFLLFAAACLAVILLPEDTLWPLRRVFPAVSCLPIAIAALAVALPGLIRDTLGYFLLLILVYTCASSLFLLLLGIRLLMAAKRRGEARSIILAATAMSALPLAAAAAYVLIHLMSRNTGP